ncbi:MAG: GGDEF domain-containing protein [Actinobacteria bacterium]|nr:GGDEF domain-containing protein [Actinomycetota bacterium]
MALATAGVVQQELIPDGPGKPGGAQPSQYARLESLAAAERRGLAGGGRSARRTVAIAGPGVAAALRTLVRESEEPARPRIRLFQVRLESAVARAVGSGRFETLDGVLQSLQSYAGEELNAQQVGLAATPGRSPLRNAELGANIVVLAGVLFLFVSRGTRLLRRSDEPHPLARRIEDLRVEARTDSLTTLGNRRAFQSDLAAAIVRRSQTDAHFALIAIDIDGLKQINDSKGHLAGDAHIKAVARSLDDLTRATGRVYRTGGDEFMVILPNKRNWDALQLAEQIDAKTRAHTGARAVSIGLTESTRTEGPQRLIRQADLALYEAKRRKSNAVTYRPSLETSSDDDALRVSSSSHRLVRVVHDHTETKMGHRPEAAAHSGAGQPVHFSPPLEVHALRGRPIPWSAA